MCVTSLRPVSRCPRRTIPLSLRCRPKLPSYVAVVPLPCRRISCSRASAAAAKVSFIKLRRAKNVYASNEVGCVCREKRDERVARLEKHDRPRNHSVTTDTDCAGVGRGVTVRGVICAGVGHHPRRRPSQGNRARTKLNVSTVHESPVRARRLP